MLEILQILLSLLMYLATLLLVVWMAGALYYDVGQASRWSWLWVLVWLGGSAGLLIFWQPGWQACGMLDLGFLAFLGWWLRLQPEQNRNWSPNHHRLSRIDCQGDTIRIESIRNTEYRTLKDYTPRYETRTFRRSHLRGADVMLCYWGSPWMCHPILIFDFGEDGRVCFSIEVRYREGQRYNLISSLYRQQELIYIVCDERDAILKRTRYGEGEECYLYRFFPANQEGLEQLFQEYADGVNRLYEAPCWYNGLTANCTTTIYNQRQRDMRWDWNLMFNGKLDRALYRYKRLDQHMPFEELKRQSCVNAIANRAPDDDFGNYIRSELAGYRLSLP